MTVTLIGTSSACATWNWNDSGHLQIAHMAGIHTGDLIMALLGNHNTGGDGFVQDSGMPAVTDLFLHSYPNPGNGGTLQWKYWTHTAGDPDPWGWTCASILDLGVVLAFRTDGAAITNDTYTIADHHNLSTSATSPITCAANRFLVACWYTQSGGITTNLDFAGAADTRTIINVADPGTLRQLQCVAMQNAPSSGTFTATATLQQGVDTCAYMTSWVGTLKHEAPCFPATGVGQIIRYI